MKITRSGGSGPSNSALSKRLNVLEKQIIETKYVDEVNVFNPLNAGQAFCLNNFAQGDTVTTRNGNRIYMERLMFRAKVTNNTLLIGPVTLRVMCILDLSPSGQAVNCGIGGVSTFLGPTGILDNTVIVNNPDLMPYAQEMKYRYKILYDKIIVINPYSVDISSITNNLAATATMTATNVLDRSVHIDVDIPLHRQTIYQDGTANIISIMDGSLLCLCFSDQAANAPVVALGTRLYFKDA